MENIRMLLIALMLLACIIYAGTAHAYEIPVQTVAWEASGEPFEGQIAVARVIQTRAKERRQTHDQVCMAKHQFSCYDINGKPTQKRKLKQSELDVAQQAWLEAALHGSRVGNANIYMRTDVMPNWLRYGLSNGKVKHMGTIGNHSFYREER